MSETRQKVEPILVGAYGDGSMVHALAGDLAQRLDRKEWDSPGREYMIMATCWLWFAGGTTAEATARKIEAVL